MPGLRDRVKCATTTTGTGPVTPGAAVAGYRAFTTAYTAPRAVTYVIEDGNAWETGIGSYDPGANTLSRQVDASSTGALLNLSGAATVAVAFLSRDNPADWPFMEANAGYRGVTPNNFFVMDGFSITSDTHGGFDTATSKYTIPQTGVYDLMVKYRLQDSVGTGIGYGVGVHTATDDGAWFSWTATTPNRNGFIYRRVSPFVAGDQIMPFYYTGNGPEISASANFVVMRER